MQIEISEVKLPTVNDISSFKNGVDVSSHYKVYKNHREVNEMSLEPIENFLSNDILQRHFAWMNIVQK